MSPSLLNLLLWVPFLTVFFISGLIFCISGYKKGLWRALISLGVTVLSAIASMLLSNVIAKALVPTVVAYVPVDDIFESIPLSESVVNDLVHGLVGSVLSLVLFVVLMFVLTFIFKLVANAIKRKSLITPQKGYKFGGLGVRFVDAVLYTILLLLPIYGTIQTYMPTVQTVLNFVDDSEDVAEIKQYIEVLSSHPVALMTKPTPIAAIYKGLQNFELNESKVNIPEIVETTGKTVTMLKDLTEKDPTEFGEDELEIIEHLRENVVEQDWFYSVFSEAIASIKTQLPTDSEDERVQILLSMLDMNKDDFKENCTALLDIFDLVIRHDLINMIKNEEIDIVKLYDSGCLTEALRIVNSSNQLHAIKAMTIEDVVTELFEEKPELAKEFLKTVSLEKLSTDAQLKAEVEAIGAVISSPSNGSILEVVVRHPMFSERSLTILLENFKLSELLGIDEPLATFINSDAVSKKLIAKLHECKTVKVGSYHFGDYVNAIIAVDAAYANNGFNPSYDSFPKGGEAIKYALELLDSYLKQTYPNVDPMLGKLLNAAATAANSTKLPQNKGSIGGLVALHNIYKLAITDSIITDAKDYNDKDKDNDKDNGKEIPKSSVDTRTLSTLLGFYKNDSAYKLVETMVKNGADPLKLNLNDEQKAALGKAIDELLKKFDDDSSMDFTNGSHVVNGNSGGGIHIEVSYVDKDSIGDIVYDDIGFVGNIGDIGDIDFSTITLVGFSGQKPENEPEITAALRAFFGLNG